MRDLIHERTGIYFEDARLDYLIEKLEPAAREGNYGSFLEFYYGLKENKHHEWDQAWEALSVQETYF
ncbi:MAG TPA: protein-glutamate O-methyltransferase CheR, partial [Verrucomicrobiae bacterium]|nr:protein-glutamate O-methyltransferase CheR [Verrucomicrobiae bacterium]